MYTRMKIPIGDVDGRKQGASVEKELVMVVVVVEY